MPGEGMEGMQGAEAVGVMSALRTGNVILDMLLAMCIPAMFQFLLPGLVTLAKRFAKGDLRFSHLFSGPFCERVIEHKTVMDLWGDTNTTDRDTRNNVLIKAIQLFLDKREIRMERSRVLLTSMTESERPCWWRDDDDDEKTPAGKLKKYRLLQKAPDCVWQPIGIYGGDVKPPSDPKTSASSSSNNPKKAVTITGGGKPALVELRVEEEEEDKGQKAEKTVSTLKYRFRSTSAAAIDAFIDIAYQWYLGELAKLEDNSRYLYEMQCGPTSSKGDREEGGRRLYKRYKLSGEKTFSSLFFSEKDMLLKILKDFTNKTGKYRVPGYPHKLGLLLHGPPGTGKTSLIKAMAAHTERSIVNVPLARISTNQELMDIMFDQQYMVLGEEVPIKLGFKDVIFVMEDVDAASKVVHRRDGKTTSAVKCEEVVDAPQPKTPWELLVESNEDEAKEVVKILMEKSTKLKAAALSSKVLCGRAKMLSGQPHLTLLVSGGLVAENGGGSLEDKAKEAKEAMDSINENYEAAGKFIKQQAQTLKQLLEAGAQVDEAFEEELLGLHVKELGPPPQLTRVISTTSGEAPLPAEEEEPAAGPMDPMTMAMMASLMGPSQGSGDDSSGGATATSSLLVPTTQKDKLNLSGLLNVLDGVVDTPERILIMTTNHPEHLDPALIRPGRIDKKILLSYMQPQHISSMIEHYFKDVLEEPLTNLQRDRVYHAIMGNNMQGLPLVNLTPAQVEQLAAEHDAVEDMILALEVKGKPFVHEQDTKAEDVPTTPTARAPARPLLKASSTKVYFDQ